MSNELHVWTDNRITVGGSAIAIVFMHIVSCKKTNNIDLPISMLRFLVFQPFDGPFSGLSRVLSSGSLVQLMGFAAAGWY